MKKTLRFKAEELARYRFEVDGRMLLCWRVRLRVPEKEGTTKERSGSPTVVGDNQGNKEISQESNSEVISSSIQGSS